jgi:hypothetical protein
MSSIPGTEALSNPTSFPRSGSIPIDFLAGAVGNGVPTDFGDGFGVGPMSTLYDNAKDANTGFNASNRPVTHTYLVNAAKFGPHAYYHEAFCFGNRIHQVNQSGTASMQYEHYVLSISEFNKYLRTDEGRRQYGGDQNCSKLMRDWKFLGSVKRPSKTMFGDDALPIIIAGRARVADIFRAYTPMNGRDKPYKGVPAQKDHAFFILRRYDARTTMDDKLLQQGLDPNAHAEDDYTGHSRNAISPYQWQVEVWMNRSGQAPPLSVYTDEDALNPKASFVGDFIYIGFIGFVHGDRSFQPDFVQAARDVIRGEDGYPHALVTLPAVDIHIAVH